MTIDETLADAPWSIGVALLASSPASQATWATV
jgi:hypothetical protein